MKIVTIVHIYYPEMWRELKEYLKNIFVPYDLIVTFAAKYEDIENDIINFKADAKIMYVDNCGYDVGPFMKALQSVNLDNYEYLIKLHTKRNLNFQYPPLMLSYYKFAFKSWRETLLSFISSEDNLKKCINSFENNHGLGMINNYKLFINKKFEGDKYVWEKVENFLKKNDIYIDDFKYIAGTMFIARASLFKFLQEKTFEFNETNRFDFHSNAHVLERVFGAIIYGQGKYIADVFSKNPYPSIKDYFLFNQFYVLFCK